ncbi:bifunctional sugar-binding transcriptional regulator/dihydroxyacetone kinase subunit DhaK [Tropicimonas sp. IMCC34043]|uniref:bifunctional sugar-binding transcriptional regulator/dihydroxyacetone kinase subunit DhaK n=1 Tax=Tropicimonas sp. IMCC34043 TaxID=2248760 RepID=UPI000E2271C7|nr:bifunctional sugar-binding transcriptional regulator/dihydroxyacetone kinase subunit DhaK [Tropicimonas sp. IMCC34043]
MTDARPKRARVAKDGTAAEDGRAPLRFGDDPLLWAAWLYYEEGLTQSEIAAAMGISRPTVVAYLSEARDCGIVNISIAGDRLRALSLARQVAEHFGLRDCLVIPSDGGPRSLIERLGDAGAKALSWHLRSGDSVGIGWGRTTLAVAVAVPDLGLKDLRVVQATGGTTAAIPYTPEACATRLSEALSARMIPMSAPAIVSSGEMRDLLLQEPVLQEQMSELDRIDTIVFGVSSLRPNSTIHTSGFFAKALDQRDHYRDAVGSLAGRFIDVTGKPVIGSLENRTIGIELARLKTVRTRIGVSGGFDKVPAILAALRGGYINVLVTDAATAEGILRADGVEVRRQSLTRRPPSQPDRGKVAAAPGEVPQPDVKKLLNDPRDAVNESLEGALLAFPDHIRTIDGSVRAICRSRPAAPGKVGLVIGGGAGHEPLFLGYVGEGLADAVAVGNVFSAPPPDRIVRCTRQVSTGAGVLHVFGNYTGDLMNFEMAAEMAAAEGIDVRAVVTTDDVASSPASDRAARRGTAGNIFVFKIAGAACEMMLSLDECERIARKANACTYTMGVGLAPCSLPETRRPSFRLGPDEIEIGIGIHGEPGVVRSVAMSADDVADRIMDALIEDAGLDPGARVGILINSLGATPMMELGILNRRIRQRLEARDITTVRSWMGHYCTSLDMTGASISLVVLDEELETLLLRPCDGFGFRQG